MASKRWNTCPEIVIVDCWSERCVLHILHIKFSPQQTSDEGICVQLRQPGLLCGTAGQVCFLHFRVILEDMLLQDMLGPGQSTHGLQEILKCSLHAHVPVYTCRMKNCLCHMCMYNKISIDSIKHYSENCVKVCIHIQIYSIYMQVEAC